MTENNAKALNKIKEAIPEDAKTLGKKAMEHKYFKHASIGILILLLIMIFSGSGNIPSENTMRNFVAADEEVESKFGNLKMTSFSVDSCEEVENKKGDDIAECVITYQLTNYREASNYMRHIPASKLTLPEETETFRFWQNKNDKWVMQRLY